MRAQGYDVAVLGGGSFGTAIAHLLASADRRVLLWVRRPDQSEAINTRHENPGYATGVALAPSLTATSDLPAAVRAAEIVLLAVPSRAFREVARAVGDHLTGDQLLVHGTKGLEVGSHKRMTEILREETCALKLGVISGPNLAGEILAGQPAGAVVASRYEEVSRRVQALFAGTWLRLYAGRDVIGTEVGGSFKNIVALAAGAVDGMGLGDNTKSLLVTRGILEMSRFGVSVGAEPATFGGLAGIGDLFTTCASPLSRNHQVGERLGRGEQLEAVLASMTQVAEGVPTTRAVHGFAREKGLELPIVAAVHAVLYEGVPVRRALERLMQRPVGVELAG